ncbi:MAG: hypothetical protein V4736_13565 [Bdellovibrionota bacterium]
MTNPYDPLIDRILTVFAGGTFKSELDSAKKVFFDRIVLDEEKPEIFEQRMSQFYDWYFFSRDLDGYGQTPLEVCASARDLRFTPEELEEIERLKKHRHSIFEFIKIKKDDVYLKDLLSGKKVVVRNSPLLYGFNEEEIFEARLLPHGEDFVFSKGFCFHPSEARKYILSEIKAHQKDADLNPEELMFRLLRMKYKSEKYPHVQPEFIYSNEPKLHF